MMTRSCTKHCHISIGCRTHNRTDLWNRQENKIIWISRSQLDAFVFIFLVSQLCHSIGLVIDLHLDTILIIGALLLASLECTDALQELKDLPISSCRRSTGKTCLRCCKMYGVWHAPDACITWVEWNTGGLVLCGKRIDECVVICCVVHNNSLDLYA